MEEDQGVLVRKTVGMFSYMMLALVFRYMHVGIPLAYWGVSLILDLVFFIDTAMACPQNIPQRGLTGDLPVDVPPVFLVEAVLWPLDEMLLNGFRRAITSSQHQASTGCVASDVWWNFILVLCPVGSFYSAHYQRLSACPCLLPMPNTGCRNEGGK